MAASRSWDRRSLFFIGVLSLLIWGSSHSNSVAQRYDEVLLLLQKCIIRSGSPPDRVDILIYDSQGNSQNVSFGPGDFSIPKGGECALVANRLIYTSSGTYTFAELLPDGWQFEGFSCVGIDGHPLTAICEVCRKIGERDCPRCSVSFSPGTHVICTFVNAPAGSGGGGGGGGDSCMDKCMAGCVKKLNQCLEECQKECSERPETNPLSVTKTCTPSTVTIGAPVTCRVTVTNSADTPQSFQMTEQAPSGMDLISASPADWVSLQDGQIIIRGSVGPSSSVTISLTFLVTKFGRLLNTVQVIGSVGGSSSDPTGGTGVGAPVEASSQVTSQGRPSTVGTAFIAASAIRTTGSGSTTAPPRVPKGILLVDSELNQLRIYLSKGDGTFQWLTAYVTGEGPVDVKAGDFDRDDKTDAVVVNALSDSLTIYPGRGDGTFRRGRQVMLPGTKPVAVAVADLDKDGLLDLAVAQNGSADLAILFGRGDGTFHSTTVPIFAGNPTSVSVADVNADGSPDLIVTATGTNEVIFFRGDGQGRFVEMRRISVGEHPVASATGDFNRDGAIDVAVANQLSESVTLFLSRGQNRHLDFARTDLYVGHPMSLISGEFFAGIPGLAAPNFMTGSVTFIKFQDGRPQIVRQNGVLSEPVSLGLGDFNEDGLLDIVVAGLPVGNLATLLGREDGTFVLKR